MLKIKTLTVGQLKTNCYLVIEEGEALIIDPGDDADYIMRILQDTDAIPKKIVATHGHYDHVLAVTELKLAYKIPFLMHRKDEFLLKRMSSSASYFGKIDAGPPPKIDSYLKGEDKIEVGGHEFAVMETPGHTPGSVSLYSKAAKCVFVGDVIFEKGALGRTDFVYSDASQLTGSIKKLLKLTVDTDVYAGHGDKTTISAFSRYFVNKVE